MTEADVALQATATDADGVGARASSPAKYGVLGLSGPLPGGAWPSPVKTGVYGYAAQDAAARGVHGSSPAGRGVEGSTTSGFGVVATAKTGVAFQSFSDTNGWALRTTRGHVGFSTAGLATIAAGTSSVTVTPGFDIRASAKVLAMLQGNPGAGVDIRYVTRDVAGDKFTIQLNTNAAVATPVAWFVIS